MSESDTWRRRFRPIYFTNYFAKPLDIGIYFDLCYTDDGTTPGGYERITRAEAEALARAESARRKDDPSFSGYAPAYIYPYDMKQDDPAQVLDWAIYHKHGYRLDGRVIVREK